jgi:flagellar biosynthesis chaperone FliJ
MKQFTWTLMQKLESNIDQSVDHVKLWEKRSQDHSNVLFNKNAGRNRKIKQSPSLNLGS